MKAASAPTLPLAKPVAEIPTGALVMLRRKAKDCRACPLWRHATQTVFGEGPATAAAMLIGEQPGQQEDQSGTPFVGPAGHLLDRALEEAGLGKVSRLPRSIRVVLEALVRHCDGKRVSEQHVRDLAAWQANGKRTTEIPFVVVRIVLQDHEPPPVPVHLVYPAGRMAAAKVRSFVGFAAERLRQVPVLSGGGLDAPISS